MSEVSVNYEAIPDELKERDQWLLWDASADTPRRPHWRNDFSVSWTDPNDWHSFAEAREAVEEVDSWGLGYVFSNTNDGHPTGVYGALDIDGCVEDGEPKNWLPSLQPFFDAGAYMELSPSGEGIHIPLAGFEAPDWWRDVHFTDGEHEGVEAYGKKFFTFTGDRLRNCGDDVVGSGEFVEDWLIEAHKAITGDDPTEEQSRKFEDASAGGRANRDEFLDEEDIREALDHIDPDVDYNTWRDIGFALVDFFDSDHTAESVFVDWSRGGSKWDRDAEDQAERIINGAESGGGRTIGTVIHHAKREGWEMPTPSSSPPPSPPASTPDQESGETADGDKNESDGPSWQYVRDCYEHEDKQEGKKYGRLYAAKALEARTSWMYVVESETLWVYDDSTGYFNSWGAEYADNLLEQSLGRHYSRSEVQEIVGRLEARNQTHREELNAGAHDGHHLCVGNGVVDLETGDLHEHSPEYKFTRGLKWDYDPARADPEPVVEFLDDITRREEDRDTLIDHLAHGLMPGHPYRSFVMMYGPGSNGKTRVGKLLRGFVGEDNAASVELQDLTGDDQFATGGLPGAFVNVGDDISVSEIRDVSILKSLTGSGTIRANEKYEKQYEFENEAAMFFSANEPPRIKEESEAIGDRLYPIEMPNRFVDNPSDDNPREKQKVPGIAKQLIANEEAMRGLLMLCVKHAQRLIETNGQYSMPEGPKERRDIYEAASDPIRRFALDYLESGEQNDLVLKDDGYAVYKAMCELEDERVAAADGFKRALTSQSIIDVESGTTRQLTPGDGQETCWRYVRFHEDAKRIMPNRLVERYFPGDSSNTDDDSDEDESEQEGEETPTETGRAAFGATPISSAADTLTGYVTVTAEVVTTQRLGESENGVKAILKDVTGAMDLVTWDDAPAEWLEEHEGECVAIQHAEVTEYNDTRQLSVVGGLTELKQVQEGVGYTAGETEDDQGTLSSASQEAATDGGAKDDGEEEPNTDDNETSDQATQVVKRIVENEGGDITQMKLMDKVKDETDLSPDQVNEAIQTAEKTGKIIKDGSWYQPK